MVYHIILDLLLIHDICILAGFFLSASYKLLVTKFSEFFFLVKEVLAKS